MNSWPLWLDEYPAGFRKALDRLVRTSSVIPRQKDEDFTNSEFTKEAQRIQRQARKLFRSLQNFHKKAGVRYLEGDTKKTAFDLNIRHFQKHQYYLDADEENLLRAGTDFYSLQLPLEGLITHMQVMREKYAGGTKRTKDFEKFMIMRLVELCTKAGIPLDKTGYERTRILTDMFFDNAGIAHPDQRLLTEARSKLRKESAENLPESE